MTLFPLNTVQPTDNIISQTIIDIPNIQLPVLKEPNKDNIDLQKINHKLLKVLEIARNNIRSREDLFLDEEHRIMCETITKNIYSDDPDIEKYRNLYEDIKKNIVTKQLSIKYLSFRFGKNRMTDILSDDIFSMEDKHIFKLNYNKYTQKFFNQLNCNFNGDVITNFVNKQNKFIDTMDFREKLLLRDYINPITFENIIKSFENGKLTLNDIIDTFRFFKGHMEEYQAPPFIMQIYPILKKHKSSLVDDDGFIQELAEKCFDINMVKQITNNRWKEILNLYMKELTQLFDKAPKTEEEIVLYRGIDLDYIGQSSKKGFYYLNRFTSATLDSNVALEYTDKYNPLIYRITIAKGFPLLFIEPFNEMNEDLVEVLLPKGCIVYIESGIKKIDIFDYKTGYNIRDSYNDICPKKTDKKIRVLDIKLLSYTSPVKVH